MKKGFGWWMKGGIVFLFTGLGASAGTIVISGGLTAGGSVSNGVHQVFSDNNTAQTLADYALSTLDGDASGMTVSTSGGLFATGAGGSFAPIGSAPYDGTSDVVNGWTSGYGTIWQGGANAFQKDQDVTFTFSGLAAHTEYAFTLYSIRANDYGTVGSMGTMTFLYGGASDRVTTVLNGAGTADGTTVTGAFAGNASGLNAREITWSFTTEDTAQDASITLAGAWNLNALVIESVSRPPEPPSAAWLTVDFSEGLLWIGASNLASAAGVVNTLQMTDDLVDGVWSNLYVASGVVETSWSVPLLYSKQYFRVLSAE